MSRSLILSILYVMMNSIPVSDISTHLTDTDNLFGTDTVKSELSARGLLFMK